MTNHFVKLHIYELKLNTWIIEYLNTSFAQEISPGEMTEVTKKGGKGTTPQA